MTSADFLAPPAFYRPRQTIAGYCAAVAQEVMTEAQSKSEAQRIAERFAAARKANDLNAERAAWLGLDRFVGRHMGGPL